MLMNVSSILIIAMKKGHFVTTLLDHTYVHANLDIPVMDKTVQVLNKLILCIRVFMYKFTDVNECAEGSDMCDPHAECTNTVGDNKCTCTIGYTGTGETCG